MNEEEYIPIQIGKIIVKFPQKLSRGLWNGDFKRPLRKLEKKVLMLETRRQGQIQALATALKTIVSLKS